MAKQIYTIGYSGFPNIDEFIQVLEKNDIQILIDVRSSPYSAFFTDYNKEPLGRKLYEHEIYYFNYARQFGARQEDLSFYKDGRLDFELFSKSEQFLEGVKNVEKSNANIVFMCAEKHPSDCHRTILVARAFSDRGYEVIHIMPNNMTMTQQEIENELLDFYFPDRAQGSLFDEKNKSEREYIEEAYRRRNNEIGFRLEDLT